jgi:hypothetical protein
LKRGEVIVDNYQPHFFTKAQDHLSSKELLDKLHQISNTKMIKKIAKRNRLNYNDDQVLFATEILNIILDEMDDKK